MTMSSVLWPIASASSASVAPLIAVGSRRDTAWEGAVNRKYHRPNQSRPSTRGRFSVSSATTVRSSVGRGVWTSPSIRSEWRMKHSHCQESRTAPRLVAYLGRRWCVRARRRRRGPRARAPASNTTIKPTTLAAKGSRRATLDPTQEGHASPRWSTQPRTVATSTMRQVRETGPRRSLLSDN